MLLLVGVVFLIVFTLAALLLSSGNSKTRKELQAQLEYALRTPSELRDDGVPDVSKRKVFSSIPWLHSTLSRMRVGGNIQRLLDQADLHWTPSRLLLITGATWAISSFLINLWMRVGAASMLFALAAGILPFLFVFWKRRKRFDLILKKLPDSLDLMVNALRVGHSVMGSLGHAAHEEPGPLGRELRLCFEEQNFGVDLRSALENLVTRVPLLDIRIITTAMLINKESGGNLAEVLEKTSHVIRERFRLQQQVRVHTAQGRLTGVILSLMPLLLGGVMYLINPAYIKFLLTSPKGLRMVEYAFVMNIIGMFIIRKVVNIRV